jgi:hypothetical protein
MIICGISLKTGSLFDAHSPDIQQLGERLIALWRLSPGRTAAHWKTVAAKTDLKQSAQAVLQQGIAGANHQSPL